MFYKKIKTKDRLPEMGGYYAIETDVIISQAHWSSEKDEWTLTDGTVCDATYPNYWLEPFVLKKLLPGHLRECLNKYLAEEITLSRFAEIINETITGQEARTNEH